MKPSKPVKKFVLGIRTKSKHNPSFNTLFIINKQSWETREEAEKYCTENPSWKDGSHSRCEIIELNPSEIIYYNNI